MFELIYSKLLNQKQEFIKLKKNVANTDLEKTIDAVLIQINQDLSKILLLTENMVCSDKVTKYDGKPSIIKDLRYSRVIV